MFWSFAKLTLLDSCNSFFSLLCRLYVLRTGPLDDDLPIRFSDDVLIKDCLSDDDVKTAIWPASVPILDGWHG
jgi:hypothetical protein